MQNKYVGDVGDFGKYGLLNALCCGDGTKPQLWLGVVWYLVNSKGYEYLLEGGKARFAGCDDDLFVKLERIVRLRAVSTIQDSGVLPPNTRFFGKAVPTSRARPEWLAQAVNEVKDCELTFLDPDTGLSEASLVGRQYVSLDEVATFAEEEGERSVVIYHHLGREKNTTHPFQIRRWLERLRTRFPRRSIFALHFHPYSARAFFVVSAAPHRDALRERADRLVKGPWGRGEKPHFELITSR